MKVLVTGANGFVGAHLCRRLVERGAEVRALVREGSDQSGLKGQSVDIVHGDILDLASLERATQGCEQVYHLAANVKFFTRNPEAMRAANTQGTRNVLTAARKAGVRKMIHTSTAAVLRRGTNSPSADETMLKDDHEAVGAYELSKLEADRVAMEACAEGLPVIIINLAAPIGPGDAKPSPIGHTIIQFLKGKIPGVHRLRVECRGCSRCRRRPLPGCREGNNRKSLHPRRREHFLERLSWCTGRVVGGPLANNTSALRIDPHWWCDGRDHRAAHQ